MKRIPSWPVAAVVAAAVVLVVMVFGEYRPHVDPTFPDGKRYEGELNADGEPHGHGVKAFPDGRRLAGEFRNGVFQGQGEDGQGDVDLSVKEPPWPSRASSAPCLPGHHHRHAHRLRRLVPSSSVAVQV